MSSPRATIHPVLYEDKYFIAVHKPPGILSHPNSGRQDAQAVFKGEYDFADRRFETPAGPLWLVHRLDQNASGVLLAAKDRTSLKSLRKLFEEFGIQKDYVVLLAGVLRPAKGTWRDHLEESRHQGKVRARVLKSGKPNAELRYEVKDTLVHAGEPLSLVQIRLISGRTHQIRAQAAYRGIPVAGDEIYGRFTLNKRLRKEAELKRLFLHAFRLAFPHPATGKNMEITDLLPEDLDQVLSRLKK